MTANFGFWYLNVEPNVFVERLLIYYNASICSCNLDSEEAQINVFVKHECTRRNFMKKLRNVSIKCITLVKYTFQCYKQKNTTITSF